jgi:hypothetical protein
MKRHTILKVYSLTFLILLPFYVESVILIQILSKKNKELNTMGELLFFVTDGSYLIIPFLFDAPETESIYMIRNAHFVYLNILGQYQKQRYLIMRMYFA